jgi:hypothetical protein
MNIKFLDVVIPFHSFKDLYVALDKNSAGSLYGPASPDKKRHLSVSGFDLEGSHQEKNPQTAQAMAGEKTRTKAKGNLSSEILFI